MSDLRHWALSHRVRNGEKVDKHGHHASAHRRHLLAFVNQETETRGQESPAHVGEGAQQERAAPKGVNCKDRGDGEQEVEGAKTD